MPQATQSTLRAVFAGIGRILSVADKVRNRPAAAEAPASGTVTETAAAPETAAPETMAPETAEPETAAPETMAPETAAPETMAPETAAPETMAPETAAPETMAPETAAPETMAPETMAPETAAPETMAPEAVPEKPEAATAKEPEAAADLPLANYEQLTIASVRARLRNLSVAQLGTLVEYEKAHAARQDFISMFERRIAKVESEK